VAIVVVAFGAALVIAQRRRVALREAYAQRILRAHEEERAWIAGELHDDALQRVAVIRHELDGLWSAVARVASDEEQHRLKALSGELLDLGVTLRNLAQRLHPAVVDQLGLVRALDVLADEVAQSLGLTVALSLPDARVTVPPATAHAAYRIAQESLRNVARHAGVRDAELALAVEPRGLVLRVRDRGRGFTTQRLSPSGLGLIGMRERAAIVGGTLHVRSNPDDGTTVEAVLPLAAS
jgi:two-component system NarL family sensor kinase